MKTFSFFIGLMLQSAASLADNKLAPNSTSTIGYYGILLGAEKNSLQSVLSKLSIHYLDQREHLKTLGKGKLASVIFQYKDVCAEDPKELGRGYELVICTFTSDQAKSRKIKGMALVFAGSKLFRIEVSSAGKSSSELDMLQDGAKQREKKDLNELAKKNALFSFFPFLYSQTQNSSTQRIFQKGQQLFSVVDSKEATYVVLLDPMILFEHQQKK